VLPEGLAYHSPNARDGATFILDEAADLEARWGRGGEVLWARGESLVIAAPPGVGKTTLAGQIVAGLIGITPDVLGYPITPATRVLYLAMDRPRQIRRALRRLFTEEHREQLAEHLVVRPGPIPSDLGNKPELLLDLVCSHGCDVVVLDSLKDAAVQLTDDRIGGNVNRAIQACNAADVDTLVLHHQRKGVGGEKPTKLEDVYGSTWITAGAGSVFLLWGEAGSEIVELSHLKQPADPVGPFTIEHDHHHGTSRISHGFDALAFLRLRGEDGATVAEAAQAEHGTIQKPGSAKWKKTERRLRALVKDGLATMLGQPQVGVTARYFALGLVLPRRGHAHGHTGLSTGLDTPMDIPLTDVDTKCETPAHTMDTPVDTKPAAPPWTNPGGLIPLDLDRGPDPDEEF
jgi:replicative DNA helicase